MWPTKQILFLYDKFTGRNLLGAYTDLFKDSLSGLDLIDEYQQNNLKSILEYALKNVPFYQREFKEYLLNNNSPREILNTLPVLTKDIITLNFNDLISNEYRNTKNIIYDHTGGSTGQPLKFAYDRSYKEIRWAIIYHNLTWAGYRLGDRHGFVYGSNYDAKKQYSLRQKFQDWIMNAFQVNAFFLNDNELNRFAVKCLKEKPKVLIGYACALFEFANYVEGNKLPIRFDFVESTSEFLTGEMRQEIERIFACKVYDRYGCREVGNIAHECDAHDGMHINWQTVYVEVVNKGKYAWLDPDYGDLVITSLRNKAMPLIRYFVGDVGKIDKTKCSCGMFSHRLFLGGGRSGDLLFSRTGSFIPPTALTITYRDLEGIKKIQFVQKTRSYVEVNIVISDEYKEDNSTRLVKRLKKVLGYDMEINFNFVDEIEKEPSGKYRLTKCLC